MQTAYLINNQIGASSKKVYGLKGDKVQIITHSINMRLVQNESGQRFWVNIDNLSEAPIKKDIVNEELTNIKSRKKEFKPKPWLKKPEEEKIVQGYYYVKSKHKDQVKNQIDNIIKELR